MQSVFMDNLRENLGELTSKESGALTAYKSIVGSQNMTLCFIAVIAGNIALALMGYHLQSVLRNTPFLFMSAVKLSIGAVLVGVALWFGRSIASYLCWRFFSDEEDEVDSFAFVAVEGMSDIVYAPMIIVYAIASFFGLGSVAIGAAVAAKAYIMYASYPQVIPKSTTLDKILCIISSFGMLIVLRGIIYVLFNV